MFDGTVREHPPPDKTLSPAAQRQDDCLHLKAVTKAVNGQGKAVGGSRKGSEWSRKGSGRSRKGSGRSRKGSGRSRKGSRKVKERQWKVKERKGSVVHVVAGGPDDSIDHEHLGR